MALQSDSVFADVDDLVKIEHRARGLGSETGVRGRLNSVPHAPAPVGYGGGQGRIYGCHEEGPGMLPRTY